MNGQISLSDYQSSLVYDRKGRRIAAPDWIKDGQRCKDCQYWELNQADDQPLGGWGVYGQCAFLHEGQKGYHQTEQYSHCEGWRDKWNP